MFNWLKDWLNEFAAWLKDLLLWVPLKLWELFLDGLASVIEAIPAPDFITNAGGMFAAIPSSVMFFAEPLQLGTGLGIVTTAYVLRFLIRRIPVVG